MLCSVASNSNIHSDQTSPRILMDAALHFVDGSTCVKLGQEKCDLCYGAVVKMVTELAVEWIMSFHSST